MSRPLRIGIEFPGSRYHVTLRGDRREAIYLNDADRQKWIDLFGQVWQRFSWVCRAYCLMRCNTRPDPKFGGVLA